jgi:hypothetical protein
MSPSVENTTMAYAKRKLSVVPLVLLIVPLAASACAPIPLPAASTMPIPTISVSTAVPLPSATSIPAAPIPTSTQALIIRGTAAIRCEGTQYEPYFALVSPLLDQMVLIAREAQQLQDLPADRRDTLLAAVSSLRSSIEAIPAPVSWPMPTRRPWRLGHRCRKS